MSLSRKLLLASVCLCLSATAAVSQGPAASSLAGTEWAGSENLKGFGNLRFRFEGQQKATMIDTAGTSHGKYTQQGSQVMLSFFNGEVVYQGTINGNQMSGSAKNIVDNRQWNWNVSQTGGAAPTPNPQHGPGPGPSPLIGPGPSPQPGPGHGPQPAPGPFPGPGPQTGPGPLPGPGPQPGSGSTVTPSNLADYLRGIGYNPQVVRPEVGQPYCVIQVKDRENWNYTIEVMAFNNGGMFLTCAVQQMPTPDRVQTTKLLQLLEANHTLAPCFFSYRAGDRRLCVRLEVPGTRPTAESFRLDLETLMNSVRRSHSLWNTLTASAGSSAPSVPSTPPTAIVTGPSGQE